MRYFLLFFLLFAGTAFADFSPHNDNYAIIGLGDNQLSKANVSVKSDIGAIYLGFTDSLWIDTFEKSSEIVEQNYLVSLFDYFKNIEYGIAHNSNGLKGVGSRSTNLIYGKINYDRKNFGANITLYKHFYNSVFNSDIEKYIGYSSYEVYIGNKYRITYGLTLKDNFSVSRYYVKSKAKLYNNMFLFLTYEDGYGINGLQYYNKKDKALKIGIMIGGE